MLNRVEGELFVWDLKPPKNYKDAKKLKKAMWKKPGKRWFSLDQEKVGSKVPHWNCQQDNDFASLDVETIKSPYCAFRLFIPN